MPSLASACSCGASAGQLLPVWTALRVTFMRRGGQQPPRVTHLLCPRGLGALWTAHVQLLPGPLPAGPQRCLRWRGGRGPSRCVGAPRPPRVRTGAFRPERQVESSLNRGFTPGEALLLLPPPPDVRQRPARDQGKPAAATPRRAVLAAPRGTRGAARTHTQPWGPRAQALEARPAPRACRGHLPGTSLGLTRDRVSSGASKAHPQLRPAGPQRWSPALVWVFSHRVLLKGVLWLRPWILPFSDNCCLIMNCLFDELGARGGVKTNPVEETKVTMGASTRPPPGRFLPPTLGQGRALLMHPLLVAWSQQPGSGAP